MPTVLDTPHGTDIHVAPQRDRYGRYLIPDPDTGELTPWTRATTVAKTLDDAHNLTEWAKRTVAVGIATKPSLAAGIIAAQDDRKQLDLLVEQAMEAAGGNERRELGTNLHRILELVDTGRKNAADVPEPWRTDVLAYQAALEEAGLTVVPELCEVILLNQPLGIAGTCDRIYRDRHGRLVIGDLKTGRFISWLAFAGQFAIYATATHTWDPATGTLALAPAVHQDHALMVHLPAGEGTCNIEALSVPVGMDAVLMALEVRRLRTLDNRRNIAVPNWNTPPAAPPARTVRHDFTAPAPTPAPTPVQPADEGARISDRQLAEIRRRVNDLHPDARSVLEQIARDANAAGVPIAIAASPTERRWHIYRALIRLAERYRENLHDTAIVATLNVVEGVNAYPGHLGPTIGSLTLDQAQAFVRAAIAVIAVPNPTLDRTDTSWVWLGLDTQSV